MEMAPFDVDAIWKFVVKQTTLFILDSIRPALSYIFFIVIYIQHIKYCGKEIMKLCAIHLKKKGVFLIQTVLHDGDKKFCNIYCKWNIYQK